MSTNSSSPQAVLKRITPQSTEEFFAQFADINMEEIDYSKLDWVELDRFAASLGPDDFGAPSFDVSDTQVLLKELEMTKVR